VNVNVVSDALSMGINDVPGGINHPLQSLSVLALGVPSPFRVLSIAR